MSRKQRGGGVTRLLVVESGAKARTIQRYLGKEFVVRACRGHVQDLPTEGKEGRKAMWAAGDGELPAPEWGYTKGAESIIRKLLADARKSGVNEVLVATDPDREGEFIAWRLAELLGSLGTVKRVTFNEITKTAIAAALEEAGDVDTGLVEAAMIRRLMDRLIGFRGSRFCRSWNLASMGRVQTPTLGFVVEREREIEAFVPIPYWEVHLTADGVAQRVELS
jgi:DNA topoisomerase-1